MCKYFRRWDSILSDKVIKQSGFKCLDVRCFVFPDPMLFRGQSISIFRFARRYYPQAIVVHVGFYVKNDDGEQSVWAAVVGVLLYQQINTPLVTFGGGYPVHHGKLNLRQPVSTSSVSRASVFTIVGVTSEGPEEVGSLKCLTSLMYSAMEMGWSWSGRERFIVDSR